jgi:hypothetical protein
MRGDGPPRALPGPPRGVGYCPCRGVPYSEPFSDHVLGDVNVSSVLLLLAVYMRGVLNLSSLGVAEPPVLALPGIERGEPYES